MTPKDSIVYETLGWEVLQGATGWSMALGALAVAAVLAAVLCGWRERAMAPRGWLALLLLRLVAIGAVATVLLGVVKRPLRETIEPSRVVLLVDQSASMELPAGASTEGAVSRAERLAATLDRVDAALAGEHEVRRAGFDVAVEYASASGDDATVDAGGETRLGAALRRVLSDHSSSPLAAIVVASDGGWNAGPDPVEAADLAASRTIPLHTLGVGPLTEPPRVALRDLAAPSTAASSDDFSVGVTLAANGAASPTETVQRVTLELRKVDRDDSLGPVVVSDDLEVTAPAGGGVIVSTDELAGQPPGFYELSATLLDAPAGGETRLSTRVEFVDRPTRVLLAAGGPSRDYRFLRDQLFRDDQYDCDVLLQSAAGAATQDAGEVLNAAPATPGEWEEYDVLVAYDFDWREVSRDATQALADWVSMRGGGVVLYSGPVFTPACLRQGLEPPLQTLLPVTLRDDPLALGLTTAPHQQARRVELTPAAARLPWLNLRDDAVEPASLWDRVGGFYSPPLPSEPKPGATVLATYGEPNAKPLFVEQLYGAGRVVYGATAELWRLRKVDPGDFVALQVGMLRHVSQGRLLGAEATGALLFDREHYHLDETMNVRYITRETGADGPTAPSAVRVTPEGGEPIEVPLAPVDGQLGVFAGAVEARQTGRYTAAAAASGGVLTAVAEVSLPALEQETTIQDAELLRRLAESTGGAYLDLNTEPSEADLARIAAATPSLVETLVELGPPDERFSEKLHQVALGVMAGALLLEWLLRRSWRLA